MNCNIWCSTFKTSDVLTMHNSLTQILDEGKSMFCCGKGLDGAQADADGLLLCALYGITTSK